MVLHSQGLLSALSLPNELEDEESVQSSTDYSTLISKLGLDYDLKETLTAYSMCRPMRLRRVQQVLVRLIREVLQTAPINVSTPYMVRPAVLDICNIEERNCPAVFEGAGIQFRLLGLISDLISKSLLNKQIISGTSLPSMVACFVQQCFSNTTVSPIIMCSAGVTYFNRIQETNRIYVPG